MKNSKKWIAGFLATMMLVSSLQFPSETVFAAENVEIEGENRASVSGDDLEEREDVDSVEGESPETEEEPEGSAILDENDTTPDENEENDVDQISGNDLQISGNDLIETETQKMIMIDELEGVYQFGSAPSLLVSNARQAQVTYSLDAEEYIYQQMLAHSQKIDILKYNIPATQEALNNLISGVLNEHPDLYFVSSQNCSAYTNDDGTILAQLTVNYDNTYDDAAFQKAVEAALATADENKSDLENAIALHDYLVLNCEYDEENYEKGTVPVVSHSAYGTFVNRIAVCDGYALAYKHLLNQMGIECYMVDSGSMGHAWNMIVLDGEYYQVDVTWDDPVWDRVGRVMHNYMFRSDEAFRNDTNKHYSWFVTKGSGIVEYEATDDRYESAFWRECTSPLVMIGNDCYYTSYNSSSKKGEINKGSLTNYTEPGTTLQNVDTWNVWGEKYSFWPAIYSGLFQIDGRVFYNDMKNIYSIALDGTDKCVEFTADITNGYICGSALCQGNVLYVLHQDPYATGKETVLTADITIGGSPEIVESGKINNISWLLDSNGKLTITGSGDYVTNGNKKGTPPWAKDSVREKTISAVINVSGMTCTSCMFDGFSYLTDIDLSGLDTSNVTSMYRMFSGCKSLTSLDVSHFNTGKVTNMYSMFSECRSLTSLDLSHFDTSNVTDMSAMFTFCSKLTSLDIRKFDTGKVTNMRDMFVDCDSLVSLDVSHFDTSNVTNMLQMFASCENLSSLDLSNFNTSKVTDMQSMFHYCISMTDLDVSSFDTSNVTNMMQMFGDCNSLGALDIRNFDTSNVTNMSYMFMECDALKNLDVSHFNTGKVTNMYAMFHGCNSLTSLDVSHFDTSNVESMRWMFAYCNVSDLDVSHFDTGNATDLAQMFYDCKNLSSLDLSNFDMGKVTEPLYDMFGACDSLTFLLTPKNCTQSNILPVTAATDKWYDEDGTEYTELPMNLSYSIALYKNGYPGDGTTKRMVYISGISIGDKVYDATPNSYIGTAVVADRSGSPISGVSLTHSYSGTLADGSVYAETADAPAQAGSYTLTFQMTGTDAEQYNLYKPSYNFRIDRKDVTVTANSVKVEKGSQLPGLSDLEYTVDGLIGNDVLVKEPSLKYSVDNISTDQDGRYEIIPYDADAGNNYSIKYVKGTLMIGNASGSEPSDPVNGDVWPEDIPDSGIIPQGLWVAGLVTNGYGYTGKAIKPEVRVYDYKTRLKEKTDYTITYTRNTKAYEYASTDQGFDTKKAPTITVTAKGNYSGKETITFKILPPDIGSDAFAADDMTIAYKAKGVQSPVPNLLWDNKQLKNKTDYTVTYYDSNNNKRDSVKEVGEYYLELTGKGNFSGTRKIHLTVSDDLNLISKVSVAKIKNQAYTGTAIMPTLVVKDKKTELTAGEHYEVSYSRNTEVGTAYALITGIEENGYSGTKRVSFKITGTPINKATVTGLTGKSFSYEGVDWEPQLTLDIAGKTLTQEKDYVVAWQKNLNAGNATAVITGKNAYTGTLKKTFKINKFDVAANADSRFVAELEQETVPYAKGGAKPKVAVKFRQKDGNWRTLVEGQDYTLSYQNHTIVNNGSRTDKMPTVTVKGKGNFSGNYGTALVYKIAAQDMKNLILTAQDKTYQEKKNIYSTKVTVTDLDGKVLTAGKDYDKKFTYRYKNETPVINMPNNDTLIRSAGALVDKNDIIPKGTVLTVQVDAMDGGNYTGTLTGEYRITENSIASASVTIPNQIYTGQEIALDKSQITVKIKGKVIDSSQYEIVPDSYKNNIKKGRASVTIKGVESFGGTKTVKFAINAKGFLWWQ